MQQSSAERQRLRRERWASWLQARLVERKISNRTLADGYLGVDEKTVRDILTGRKALGPERLELLEEIAEDFVEDFVRETFGERGARLVLARIQLRLAERGMK